MRAPARAVLWASIAFVLVAWVTSWRFPLPSAAPLLDESFQQALGRALVERLRFGADVAFTYGPLGWFGPGPHEPALFAWKVYGFELGFKLALALFLGAAALRVRSAWTVLAFGIALAVPDAGLDASFFVAIAAVTSWALPRARRSPLVILAPLAVLAVLASCKFTYSMECALAVLAIAAAAARASIARAALVVGLFTILLVALWTAIGQAPADLPRWVATSAALSRAFGDAMSIPASPLVLALAIAAALPAGAAALLHVRGASDRRRAAILAVFWLAALFLAFQAGFTRATGNEITYFGFVAAGVFLLGEPERDLARERRPFALARAATCAIALVGFGVAHGEHGSGPLAIATEFGRRVSANTRAAFALGDLQARRDAERAERAAKYDLPRVERAVGDASIDVFGSEQGIVFLNDLHWRPRPVFQSYSVFTDALSRANARCYESARAPRFVLHRQSAIDGRLATSEDARTLHVLLRDYRAVLGERGFVLFERRPDAPRASDHPIVLERDLWPGETLELGEVEGPILLLEADARATAAGRARSILAGAPRLFLEVEADDGVRETNRIVPELIAGGAIVRPWLANEDDWARWLTRRPVHALVRVRFVAPAEGFATPIRVRVRRADDLVPATDPADEPRILWPMFDPPPTRVECAVPPGRTTQRGWRDLLVVHAPAEIAWKPAPGRLRLRAQFGFLPSAWKEGRTDGVLVRVERRSAAGAVQIVFERALDPTLRGADANLQALDVAFEVGSEDEIVLVTDPGPERDAERDETYWTGVSLTAAN